MTSQQIKYASTPVPKTTTALSHKMRTNAKSTFRYRAKAEQTPASHLSSSGRTKRRSDAGIAKPSARKRWPHFAQKLAASE
jgi:hypothetical protein